MKVKSGATGSLGRTAGTAVVLLALAACGSDSGTTAQDSGGSGATEAEESFYEGETVNFVVPYDPGGGYDAYARALAPHLGECLGAEVVVRNEPGAGSLLATNATGASSPEDRRIQITNTPGNVSAQIAGAPGVQYDLSEMGIIGRISAPADSVGVAAAGNITDFQQIIDASDPRAFVATGPGSNEYITASILARIYDFPINVVTGFPGSGDARLAVVSGDADAHVQSWDSQIGAITGGDMQSVLLVGDEPVEELPGVPTVMDYEPAGENGEALRESLVELVNTGRGVVTSPGLSESQLTELREGFDCAVANDDFVAALEEQERPLNVLGGAEWEEILKSVLDAPEDFQTIVSESF